MSAPQRPRGLPPQIFFLVIALLLAALAWWHFSQPLPEVAERARVPVPARRIDPGPPPPPPPIDPRRCLAGTAARASDRPMAIHRWIDARGVVHYSDRAPTDHATQPYEIITRRDDAPVSVQLDTLDAALPPHARSRAVADAVGIGKVLRDVLRLPVGERLALRAIVVGDDAAFVRLAGDIPSRTGVYRPADRLIVVRARRDADATLRTLRHEIVHALVHEWLGQLPTALNEGLAAYFAEFRIHGLGGSVDLRPDAAALRASMPRPIDRAELSRLLGLPHAGFYAAGRDSHYAGAQVLVGALLATTHGRETLGRVLASQAEQPCQPIAAAELLDELYPGGLDALAQAWAAHLDASTLGVQQF